MSLSISNISECESFRHKFIELHEELHEGFSFPISFNNILWSLICVRSERLIQRVLVNTDTFQFCKTA